MRRRQFFRIALVGSAVPLLPPFMLGGCADGPVVVVGSNARVDTSGRTVETLRFERRVRVATAEGALLAELGGDGSLGDPIDALGRMDGSVAVADTALGILTYVGPYRRAHVLMPARSREALLQPSAVTEDAGGALWVADFAGHTVLGVDASGAVVSRIGGGYPPGDSRGLNGPVDLAFDALGQLHVVDAGHARVAVYAVDGERLFTYDAPGMRRPRSVAVSSTGRSYVLDATANSVFVFADGRHVDTLALEEQGIPRTVRAKGDLLTVAMS